MDSSDHTLEQFQGSRSDPVPGPCFGCRGPLFRYDRATLLAGRLLALALVLVSACVSLCHGQDDTSPDRIGDASAHATAKALYADGKYEQALQECDRAIDDSFPDRIYNRIQATAVRCCLALNRRKEALRRIEAIHRRDDTSPHLSLMPLVWDERLPADERYQASPEDLRAKSVVWRMAAASALLQDTQFRSDCKRVLDKVQTEEFPPLSQLAEAQVWRLEVSDVDSLPLAVVQRRQRRVSSWPTTLRAGPQFVIGRSLRQRHKPDQAVLELLWAPMMAPDDPFFAASSLAEAIGCLESAGRTVAARRLRVELQQRFGETSSARRLAEKNEAEPSSGAD